MSYAIFGLKWIKNHMDMGESEIKQTVLKVYETNFIIKKSFDGLKFHKSHFVNLRNILVYEIADSFFS